MSTSPSLSVLVNNYNYAQYLPEALESVLSQMREGDELVVVDDGSTDDSARVLETYRSRPGVNLVMQDNAGQVAAVARGIREADKDVVVLLDSDDYFLEGYLDRLRQIYTDFPEVGFVFVHPQVFGENPTTTQVMRKMVDRMAFPPGRIGTTRWSTCCFAEFVGVPTSGNSMRLDLARKLEPRFADTRPEKLEQTLLDRLMKAFGVSVSLPYFSADGLLVRYASSLGALKYYDPHPGFCYRIHSANRYARLSYMRRRYQSYVTARNLHHKLGVEDGEILRPTAKELESEISTRTFPLFWRRRFSLKLRYMYVVLLSSRGSMWQKLQVLAAIPAAGKKAARVS